jgi:molybdopterin-guanine dinucleotide biosynthesis protein B
MKVFSVIGFTKSGKTTTIEAIIKELRKRNYSVGTVKDIHFQKFTMDIEGKNTYRHKMAGSQLVTARGLNETDILYPYKMDVYDLLRHYEHDYVILEGIEEINAPKIIAAKDIEGIEAKLDEMTCLITGRISNEIDSYKNFKAINALTDIEELVDFIEENVFELLPHFEKNCCRMCGYDCETLCKMIIKGDKKRSDCILCAERIQLFVDDKEIQMVPFVQRILTNAITGVVGELNGYEKDHNLKIEINGNNIENKKNEL